MFSEWLYLPEAAAAFLCDPGVWLFLIGTEVTLPFA